MQLGGPAVRGDLALVDALLESLWAAAAEKGRLARVVGKAPVEEDGKLELVRDAICECEPGLARAWLVFGSQGDEGDDVDRADARVRAGVVVEVDPVARAADAREQCLDELVGRSHERVDGAVVVPVDVDVEQPRRLGHGFAQSCEYRLVAPLRDVRDRLERQRHRPRIRSLVSGRRMRRPRITVRRKRVTRLGV